MGGCAVFFHTLLSAGYMSPTDSASEMLLLSGREQ